MRLRGFLWHSLPFAHKVQQGCHLFQVEDVPSAVIVVEHCPLRRCFTLAIGLLDRAGADTSQVLGLTGEMRMYCTMKGPSVGCGLQVGGKAIMRLDKCHVKSFGLCMLSGFLIGTR